MQERPLPDKNLVPSKNLMNDQLQQVTATGSPVTLLINGKLRLTGKIRAYDSHMLMLESGGIPYFIYRHSISQIFEQRPSAKRPARNQTQHQPRELPKNQTRTQPVSPQRTQDSPPRKPRHAPSAGNNASAKSAAAKVARPDKRDSAAIDNNPRKQETPYHQPSQAEPQLPSALGEELLKWLKKSG